MKTRIYFAAILLALLCLHVQGSVVYVNLNNVSPAAPYASWAAAATNIQDAIDVANPGDQVLVTNGVYQTGGRVVYDTLTNRVAVTKPLTVQSVNGAAVTIIKGNPVIGDSAVRCVYLATNAVLTGFTLTQGATRSDGDGRTEQSGGGAWCEDASSVISNCVIWSNTANESGGGVFQGALDNCLLVGNAALSYHGGGGANNCSLTNCTLASNTAANGGGANGCTLDSCVLTNNSTYDSTGGGADHSTLNDCLIINNSSDEIGGGASYSTLTNCALIGNSSLDGGGGAESCILVNCTLTGNSVPNNGGGAEGCTLINCILTSNSSAYSGGGALYSDLYNCLLANNSAVQDGGGVQGCHAVNCTIVNNFAGGTGGGADFDSQLDNCIVYFNTAFTNANYSADNCALNNSCTTPLPDAGVGNIAADPQFVNLAGGDLHLQSNSPCINAGNNDYVATIIDLEGTPRILGWVVDAGAYEFPIPVSLAADFTNVAVGFVVNFSSQVFAGNISGSTVDFGDGTVVSNQLSGAHGWVAPGDHLVTLTVFSYTYPAGVSATVTIHVFAGNYFVSRDNSNPVPPYTSWATAATNIQDAVDAAVVGGTVMVSNGVYSLGGRPVYGPLTNRVAVDKPLTIRGVNGPQFTAIQGFLTNNDNAVRCVYLTNGAALIGFTLTNGSARNDGDWVYEYSGGGAWCESSSVLVSNCVFLNNRATGLGGGIYGGTLDHCVLANNFSDWDGGGACNSSLNHCVLTGNNGVHGGGACSSTLNDCTLTDNLTHDDSDHTSNGGGASNSTLTNCIISGNTSLTGGGVGDSTLVDCAVNGNHSLGNGGGCSGSTLVNCTVVGNVAGNGGGGINSSVATNCIVYFNTASGGTNYSADSTLVYCDTTPLPGLSANNITSDPLLADLKHISSVSPCRSAGTTMAVSGVDMDGDGWLNPPSIGCDEFYSSSATGALAVAISATFTNVATGFVSDFIGQISGHASANRWDFGDGTIVSNKVFIPHSWAAAGNYTVTLTVFNTDHPVGVNAAVTIFVLQQPVHYVALGNANPVAPFTSWAAAATNIQDAVDAAFANGMVVVSNGVYQSGSRMFGTTTNRVVVAKPLVIQSVNGANVTIIDGGHTMRCLYLANHVSVTGFTLRNGVGNTGGGVYCEDNEVLNDCVLTGNSSPFDWSTGGGAYRGVLNRCGFTWNSASYGGGGAAFATLNSCVLSNNLPTAYGGGAYGCQVNSCLVISNSAGWGGGLADCTANNSLILNNRAASGGGGLYYTTANNCTIVGNFVTGPGGYPGGGGSIGWSALTGCVIYDNPGGNYYGFSSVLLDHCCTTPDPGGSLNITNAPRFADPVNGDFHLQGNSPCINSGNNLYAPGPTDFDGLARVTGGTVDIGAFEFQTPSSLLAYAWAQQYGLPTDGSADDADSDGDGMKNWSESHARTNPTNAVAVLKMLPPLIDTNLVGVTVSWQSVAGVSYFIQRGTNLASPPAFSTILDNISGQAGMTTWQDETATGDGSLFYRVGVH
ncbi:MAG TPA: choice-of-anchor Q domain-containing protein [Verrucomicrobiae bacterium]|nr:choice-of-anchor Q domain-containing protein [Verrucomicrobiae bacterium]